MNDNYRQPFKEFFEIGKNNIEVEKMTSNIRRYCIAKFKHNGIFSINKKELKYCKNSTLRNAYFSMLGSDVVVDFLGARNTEYDSKWKDLDVDSDIDYVYFFVSVDYFFIKIGYSKNPLKRIKEIQTGCPFKLKILHIERGGLIEEREYHERFKANNTNGEWFKIRGDLKTYVEDRFNFWG